MHSSATQHFNTVSEERRRRSYPIEIAGGIQVDRMKLPKVELGLNSRLKISTLMKSVVQSFMTRSQAISFTTS